MDDVFTLFFPCPLCTNCAGDGADEDLQENLPLKLSECPAGGVVSGTVLEISDFTQNLDVRV